VLGSALYGALAQAPIDGSRLTGASGDPNETAALLLAASVLALVLGLGERRRSLRVLALLAAPAGLFGLVATASRGGAIALGITALAAIVLAGRWRRQVTIAASTATVLVIGWFALLAPASSRTHITSTESGRTTLWTVAGRVIEANPVVGLGNDNFAPEAKRYLIQPGATNGAGDILATAPKPVHNAYLELWADLGIVGLALFAALVVGALRCAWRATKLLRSAGRRADEILARGLAVAIIAMLAADLFLSDLYSKQLFLLIALAPAMLRAARLQLAPAALAHTGFRPVGPSPRWASTAS
jgi:O-antigen ligase